MRNHPRWRAATRAGPPPWGLYLLILLLDIAAALLILGVLVELGDSIEDLIWPGGVEWVE